MKNLLQTGTPVQPEPPLIVPDAELEVMPKHPGTEPPDDDPADDAEPGSPQPDPADDPRLPDDV